MKWDCGLSYDDKYRLKIEWHDFFCLFPRQVASHDCRWLETIERRGDYVRHCGWVWSYRAKEQKT